MACACGVRECDRNAKVVRSVHGTTSMYANHKCRCAPCREANASVCRARNATKRVPKPEVCGCGNADCSRRTRRVVKHGLTAYTDHKCRCAVCREAMRKYQAQRRAKKRAKAE